MSDGRLIKCECEHIAHVKDDPDHRMTPNGNPGHAYAGGKKGKGYFGQYMRIVATPYGHFTVCKDCAEDCYQDFPAEMWHE